MTVKKTSDTKLRSNKNKLSDRDVRRINTLLETSTKTLDEIGRMFGVSAGTISDIKQGIRYSDITKR